MLDYHISFYDETDGMSIFVTFSKYGVEDEMSETSWVING